MKKKNKYLIGIIAIIVIIAGALIISADAGSSKVQVAGSTSVQPVAEKLVEVYKESHPDAQINVQGGGSSVGIKSAEDGSADIGMCSKALDNNSSLQQYELGKDGIVIAINTQNQVSDLSVLFTTFEILLYKYSINLSNLLLFRCVTFFLNNPQETTLEKFP